MCLTLMQSLQKFQYQSAFFRIKHVIVYYIHVYYEEARNLRNILIKMRNILASIVSLPVAL